VAKKQKKPASGITKFPRLASHSSTPGKPRLYTLEIFLISGPISEKFAKKNPEMSRTIQI